MIQLEPGGDAYGPLMTTTPFVHCAGLLGLAYGLLKTCVDTRLMKLAPTAPDTDFIRHL